jgi:hypothetical protein
MNEIITSAKKYQEYLPREIMAHRLSSEYHRHWNMALGGASTVLTTLVGSAIFTGLVSQLGLDGQGVIHNPFEEGQGMGWLYMVALILSILAPILSALHTFMHHAEDASTHRASVEGYANVLRRLTIFLAGYDGSIPVAEKTEALKEYDEIMKEYNSVLGKSLTLTNKAYKDADEKLQKDMSSSC